ncbi:MAG TPA: class I SAM-dependent methyltransferase [Methanocella sp.]|jgi:hypothetical protein
MQCRFCRSNDTKLFLALGETPLANSFLSKEDLKADTEPIFPLDVYFCKNCGLSQISYVVPPENVFKNYIYFTSTSDLVHKHSEYLAASFKDRFKLTDKSFVMEIASNDGCVLSYFKKTGVRTLGVEPAENIAKVAIAAGIETYVDFFNDKTAAILKDKYGKADVIIGRHVFAHVPEIHGFVKGLKDMLAENGVIAIEAPYLADFIDKTEFDTIYHEHLSYLSMKPMSMLFAMYDMELFDVEHVDIHGGSMIYYIGHKGRHQKTRRYDELLAKEVTGGYNRLETYENFARRTGEIKVDLLRLLKELKKDGKSIAAYGAPAKGNTLLNYCGITSDMIDFVVDKSPYKQGLYTPGTRIPVFAPEKLASDMPDYTLMLAWNFADEILQQQKEYREKGGKFIIPIPRVTVV